MRRGSNRLMWSVTLVVFLLAAIFLHPQMNFFRHESGTADFSASKTMSAAYPAGTGPVFAYHPTEAPSSFKLAQMREFHARLLSALHCAVFVISILSFLLLLRKLSGSVFSLAGLCAGTGGRISQAALSIGGHAPPKDAMSVACCL